MKRLVTSIAVAAVVLFAVAGCGKKDTPPGPGPAPVPKTKPEAPKTEPQGKTEAPAAPRRSLAESAALGVSYLAKNQNETGSFGKQREDVGITGMVVYALASGPKAKTPEVKAVVDKAAQYLLKNVRENGSINNDEKMLAMYRTSLAMLALAAADPVKYEDAIKGGREFLKKMQFSEENGGFDPKQWQYGGWNYDDKKEGDVPDPDLSNVQFVVTALRDSGLSPDDEAFKRAIVFLNRCQNSSETNDMPNAGNDGGGVYAPIESKAGDQENPDGTQTLLSYGSMTYALLKSFIFCSVPKEDKRVQAAYKWVTAHYTVDENPPLGKQGLFYYYLSMARSLDAFGVDKVKTADGREHDWRAELSAKIISLQKDDGSWVNEADRWMESDPTLVTGYALSVLNFCRK